MSYQKKLTRSKLCFVLALFVAVITGCKDSDKPDAEALKPSTESILKKSIDSLKAKILSFGDFSEVTLSASELARLFTENSTQKILLQFVDDNTNGDDIPYTLIAYGATKANRKTSAVPAQLTISPNTNPINITGKKYLANLELTRKQINDLIGNTNNRPITTANAMDLIFTPEPTTSSVYLNYVVYKVNVPTDKKRVDDQLLNPSPPADPCNPCDQDPHPIKPPKK